MERDLEERRPLRSELARIISAVDRDPCAIFGTPAGDVGRFHTDVVVDLGQGSSVHQVVALEVRPARRSAAGIEYSMDWKPVGRQRMLPDFHGVLSVTDEADTTVLTVRGSYRAPLGPVGAVGDAVVGKRVARRSLAAFVDDLARRMDLTVDADLAHGWRPPAAAADLRPPATENWLG
jgi:hypothetical protein